MATAIIWGSALAAYLLFRLWYDNWSGPLKSSEIEAFLAQMEGRYQGTGNDPVLRPSSSKWRLIGNKVKPKKSRS